MTPEQEIQLIDSLNQIAKSLKSIDKTFNKIGRVIDTVNKDELGTIIEGMSYRCAEWTDRALHPIDYM